MKMFHLKSIGLPASVMLLAVFFIFIATTELSAQNPVRSRQLVSPKLKFELERKCAWEFPENSLGSVLTFIEKLHRIKLQVDDVSLSRYGITKSQAVHITGTGTLTEMLTSLLHPINLEWSAEGDTIYIRAQNQSLREKYEKNASKTLKRKLSKPNHYQFKDDSLEEVLIDLTKSHNVIILIDSTSLSAAGISQKVELNGKGFQSLRLTLSEVLKPAGLTWGCNEDRILIKAMKK